MPERLFADGDPDCLVSEIREAIKGHSSVPLLVRRATEDTTHDATFEPSTLTTKRATADRLKPTEVAFGEFRSETLHMLGKATLKFADSVVVTVYGQEEIIG